MRITKLTSLSNNKSNPEKDSNRYSILCIAIIFLFIGSMSLYSIVFFYKKYYFDLGLIFFPLGIGLLLNFKPSYYLAIVVSLIFLSLSIISILCVLSLSDVKWQDHEMDWIARLLVSLVLFLFAISQWYVIKIINKSLKLLRASD